MTTVFEVPPTPIAANARRGSLIVTSGQGRFVAKFLNGTYAPSGTNHGKIVYSSIDRSDRQRILLYYWDGRDGPEQEGWWFGPEVGTEEVWAHNRSEGSTSRMLPPVRGWCMLDSGMVDPDMTVTNGDFPLQPRYENDQPQPQLQGGAMQAFIPPPRIVLDPRRVLLSPHQTHTTVVPPPKKRKADHQCLDTLRSWLAGLDGGMGSMLQYFDRLSEVFDADLAKIASGLDTSQMTRGIAATLSSAFWDVVGVKKAGHKLLFAQGIWKLER